MRGDAALGVVNDSYLNDESATDLSHDGNPSVVKGVASDA